MKKAAKIVIFVLILAVVFTIVPATIFAHPKGPDTMPAQSLNGTHKAIFQVPEGSMASHVVFGLMVRTGLCHD